MKLTPNIVIVGFVLSAAPASAAPPQVEDYCWAKAAQIWFNGRGDREHSSLTA